MIFFKTSLFATVAPFLLAHIDLETIAQCVALGSAAAYNFLLIHNHIKNKKK